MALIIGYILLGFLLVRLAVSTANCIGGHYAPRTQFKGRAKVSVLIPARNEDRNIGRLLGELVDSDYKPYEIIVYDDQSEDRTAAVVEEYASKYDFIRQVSGQGPATGWLGKNHACNMLAYEASGDIMLFLDADVHIGTDLIGRTLSYRNIHSLALLSLFPEQLMPGGTKLVVPLMNWILLSLLPLSLIRRSALPAFAAANGQFMMFDAAAYRNVMPHELHKADPVEDIATIRTFKEKGFKAATLLGDESITCEMYSTFGDAVRGFSKNIFRFFGGSPLAAFAFALVTTATPAYLSCIGEPALCTAGIASVILIRLAVSLASKQPPLRNILLMIPQQAVLWYIMFRALGRKKLKWKGRSIYA